MTTGFGMDHLPYGVASHRGRELVVVRLEDDVIDLGALAEAAVPPFDPTVVSGPDLAPLMAAGPQVWAAVRSWLQETLAGSTAGRIPLAEVELRMPFAVADYVDFYASLNHASNVGKIFRPDAEPLLPNWRHLPVGYHGRAGTVVPSGTPIVRPHGQRRPGADGRPGVRAVAGARHRGRARLRRRSAERDGGAGHRGRVRRSRLRRDAARTTGRRATSRPGSTSRSVRSSASRSRPRSRRGSPRWPRWKTHVSRCPARTPNRSTTCESSSRPVTRSTSRSSSTARSCRGRRTPRCTGHPRRCWPT